MAISGPANRNSTTSTISGRYWIGVAVDLGGTRRQDQREHAGPVQPGDRDQVEEHEREVRQHERERDPAEIPRDSRPDQQPADRRERQVGDRAGQRRDDGVTRAVAEIAGVDRRGLRVRDRRRQEPRQERPQHQDHRRQQSAAERLEPHLRVERQSSPQPRRRVVEPCGDEGPGVLAGAHADQQRHREVEREPEAERGHDAPSIQRCTSGGGVDVAVRQGEGREDAPRRLGGIVGGPRVHLADRLAGLETVADLAAHHEPHGGVDRVALAHPARAQRDARRADRLRVHAGERTVPVGFDREDDGRRGQDRLGVVHHAGVAALRLDHASEALQRLPAVQGVLRARHRFVVSDALRRLQPLRGEQHREVAQPSAERPAQELDRLDDVERVPDGVAERLRHVRDGDVRGATPSARQRQARPREHLGILRRLHERPRSRLDVEQDQIGVHGELLRHHARGDQRDRRHRRGGVAQGVQLPVGRDEVRGLRGDGAPDIHHLRRDLVGRQVRPQPGDRLELVQRAARVSQPAARQLGDRHPERRRDGCERERHAVGHPAGRVLVDRGTTEVAERHRVARIDHRPGQRERLVVVESPQQARHEERRGERVGDVARGVPPNERLDLVGCQRLPVALARHDDARIVDAHANPIRSAKLATVEALDLHTEQVGDRVPQVAERVPCPDLVRAAEQTRREQRGPFPACGRSTPTSDRIRGRR